MKKLCALLGLSVVLSGCTLGGDSNPGSERSGNSVAQTELQKYVGEVSDFQVIHSTTIGTLVAEIQRLAEETDDHSNVRYQQAGNSLHSISSGQAEQMSAKEILDAIGRQYELSTEAKALLRRDETTLENLLLKVKQDQIRLLQIVPPPGTPTGFHEVAVATIDLETSVLVSMLNIYPLPELFRIGPELKELPTRFFRAKAELERAVGLWTEAITYLVVLQLSS